MREESGDKLKDRYRLFEALDMAVTVENMPITEAITKDTPEKLERIITDTAKYLRTCKEPFLLFLFYCGEIIKV